MEEEQRWAHEFFSGKDDSECKLRGKMELARDTNIQTRPWFLETTKKLSTQNKPKLKKKTKGT